MTYLLALFFIFSTSVHANSIKIGFNQAWFKNKYAYQYLDGSFDLTEVDRIFKLAKNANSHEVRLWFFESAGFPMLTFKDNKLVSIKEDYLKNIILMLKSAQKHDLKIYMTLFDAHAYRPDKLSSEKLERLKYLYSKDGRSDFMNHALGPLLKNIAQNNLNQSISKIDLINEGDTVAIRKGLQNGWKGLKEFICDYKSKISSIDSFKTTPITYSIRLHPLVKLPKTILDQDGELSCTDFIDFHSYHNNAKIKNCNKLKKYSESNQKRLVLGEFGQSFFTHKFSDKLQLKNTKLYLENLASCGFVEGFAWRLSDIRPGVNKEARYSFEAFNQMRPAYYLIQEFNKN